jgi:hypothetical protein
VPNVITEYAEALREFFDSEIERTTVASIIENQGLLQENKQLNALMTDYEQTLETVMTKFRQHAVWEFLSRDYIVSDRFHTASGHREGDGTPAALRVCFTIK